jgi:hypothetical protein
MIESQTLTFSIGGVSVRLASVDPTLRLEAKGHLARFLATHASPQIHVRAAWGAIRATSGGQLFDSGSLWRMYRQGSGCVLDFRSPIFGEIPYKQALFNSSFTAGEIRLHAEYFDRDQPVFPLEPPLDELLFVNYLATGHGADVHACGLIDSDGRGHLFLGQSGAGKTTMARQWEKAGGVEILSDDRIILRIEDRVLWMYGTPWHGEARAASPARVPVAQLFFIAKGPRNEAVSLRPATAVARLMATSFMPFHNAGALGYTLAFFERTAQLAPIRELRFVPDVRVVDFVRRLGQ